MLEDFHIKKNHNFLFEVFRVVCNKLPDARLVLVGKGELENELREKTKKYKIDDKIIFLGECSNVNEIYSAMDIFCLTSFFEGMPLVLVEAQASGLPCVVSNTITKEAKLSENYECISLENTKDWCDEIMNFYNMRVERDIEKEKFIEYDIYRQIKVIEKEYLN